MSGGTKLAALSQLLDGFRRGQRAGIQYKGHRDIYQSAGYLREPKFEDYEAYYTRDGLARRLVDMPGKTTWREPPEISEAGKPDGTAFTKAFAKLADRLNLWREFEVVDRRSGIGRYGILLIGTRGTEDLQMRQPLARLPSVDDILYVRAYDERHALIKTWVTDTGNARFGLPETYEIRLTDHPGFLNKAGLIVHASRVLHVAEDADDRVYGPPRLERVLNRLFDLEKIAASTAESYWQTITRTLTAEIDPTAEFTDSQQDDLSDHLDDMLHDLRRQFVGQGVKLGALPIETPNPEQVRAFLFSVIAASVGIPQRILFGNEQGSLASSTDEATYFGMINERQEHFAEPQLVRAFIDRLLEWHALPAPETGAYDVQWAPLFQESETAVAEANLKRAQAAAALTPMGGDPLSVVEIDEFRNVWLVPKKPGPVAPPPPQGTPLPPEVT